MSVTATASQLVPLPSTSGAASTSAQASLTYEVFSVKGKTWHFYGFENIMF